MNITPICKCTDVYTCIRHTMENHRNPEFLQLESALAAAKERIHVLEEELSTLRISFDRTIDREDILRAAITLLRR